MTVKGILLALVVGLCGGAAMAGGGAPPLGTYGAETGDGALRAELTPGEDGQLKLTLDSGGDRWSLNAQVDSPHLLMVRAEGIEVLLYVFCAADYIVIAPGPESDDMDAEVKPFLEIWYGLHPRHGSPPPPPLPAAGRFANESGTLTLTPEGKMVRVHLDAAGCDLQLEGQVLAPRAVVVRQEGRVALVVFHEREVALALQAANPTPLCRRLFDPVFRPQPEP